MGELITLATINTSIQAHLLKSRLESEGIPCFLTDENINTLLPAGPFGGIKVQVHLSDSLRAFDILYDLQEGLERMEV
jgi:hypothetical protein